MHPLIVNHNIDVGNNLKNRLERKTDSRLRVFAFNTKDVYKTVTTKQARKAYLKNFNKRINKNK